MATESEQVITAFGEVADDAQEMAYVLGAVPDDAARVVAHIVKTFGSVRKALRWMRKPCGALNGDIPLELLRTGQKDRVEDELVLIEEGSYV